MQKLTGPGLLATIEENLFLPIWALADSLEHCAIFNECPRFLRVKNAADLVFFDREDEARVLPDGRCVEFISVRSRRCRDSSIGRVFLHRMP